MQRPIRPEWLLRQADELGGRRSGAGQPRNADLRRAVSSAYYALFHHVVGCVTGHVLASGSDEQRYEFGRHITHAAIRQVCTWIGGTAGRPAGAQAALALMRRSTDLIDVAIAFVDLNEARHRADYDNLADFTKVTTLSLVDQAKDALRKLDSLKGTPELESFLTHITLRSQARL